MSAKPQPSNKLRGGCQVSQECDGTGMCARTGGVGGGGVSEGATGRGVKGMLCLCVCCIGHRGECSAGIRARLGVQHGLASWAQMLVDFSSGTGLQWGCCVLLPPWLRGTIESVVVGGGRWVVDKLCPSWWFPAIVCEDLSGCSGCLKGGWCSRGGGQVSDCCCCCVWRLALQDGQGIRP